MALDDGRRGGQKLTFRWSEEALAAFRKRQAQWDKDGTVREHICKGPPKPPRPLKRQAERSRLEVMMEQQLSAAGIKDYVTQHIPLAPRRWRLDFAWPQLKVAIEVQGMVHRIKGKFKRDIEKRAELMLAGWEVLEVDGESINDGMAIYWAKKLLGMS